MRLPIPPRPHALSYTDKTSFCQAESLLLFNIFTAFLAFGRLFVSRTAHIDRRGVQHVFDKRIRPNREFFRIDPNQVKAAILLAEIKEITPRNDVVVDETDKRALKEAVARSDRRASLKFSNLQIPIGAVLTLVKDASVASTVVKDGQVNFEGQFMSPSAGALKAVQRLGYNWSAVSGSDYWEYEHESLATRRLRLEDEE